MATVTTEKAQVEGIKTGIRCAQWYTISVLIRSKIHHYINVLVQRLCIAALSICGFKILALVVWWRNCIVMCVTHFDGPAVWLKLTLERT